MLYNLFLISCLVFKFKAEKDYMEDEVRKDSNGDDYEQEDQQIIYDSNEDISELKRNGD